MDFLKKYWNYIALFFAGLIAWFAWKKKDSAEALLQNQDVKEKLLNKDKEINKDQAVIDSEAQKRQEIEQQANQKENTNASIEELQKLLGDNSNNQ